MLPKETESGGSALVLYLEFFSAYLAGAAGYGVVELLFRGSTHWTMPLLGGLCMCFIYYLANYRTGGIPQKAVCSACVITVLELLCGLIVNKALGWNVWDYSQFSMNFLGQICLRFSFYWLLLSLPLLFLSAVAKRRLFRGR